MIPEVGEKNHFFDSQRGSSNLPPVGKDSVRPVRTRQRAMITLLSVKPPPVREFNTGVHHRTLCKLKAGPGFYLMGFFCFVFCYFFVCLFF